MSSMRVVFSIDFTSTRVFGVIGELASFSGLKFRTEFRILLEVVGLVRTRTESVFKVASTSRASLGQSARVSFREPQTRETDQSYLLLSCSTPSILSKRPVASASSCRGSNNG